MKELSKEEMAQKIGVTARTMDRYHNDISKMQLGDFLELCDMTGLKVSLQWKDDYLQWEKVFMYKEIDQKFIVRTLRTDERMREGKA